MASTGRSISTYRFNQLCEFIFARKHFDKKSIVFVSELEFAWSTNDGISVWTTLGYSFGQPFFFNYKLNDKIINNDLYL